MLMTKTAKPPVEDWESRRLCLVAPETVDPRPSGCRTAGEPQAKSPLMFVAGSSTTLLGLHLIISLAGCVIIERPLACVWISRLRRPGVRRTAGFPAGLRAAQAVIGCSGTLDLRQGSARNNRETECDNEGRT